MCLLREAANFTRRRIRFLSKVVSSRVGTISDVSYIPLPIKSRICSQRCLKDYTWRVNHKDPRLWLFASGSAAIVFGINVSPVLAKDKSIEENFEKDTESADITGLRKIEDGSVISNIHTSKWRVFTDHARDLFMEGKLEEAERLFLSALEEAKKGFGERDSHVASACNNLAELYRVSKAFDKAEPLYLEAINILEEAYGPEDIRVGSALHNLGQFYLVQRKLEEAHICYERALKIKARVLGLSHTDYADTMYHLGKVLYLQGKEKDAEAFIQDSIRILEEGGQAESTMCLRRLQHLAQIYLRSNRPSDAENVQRKILHAMELTEGWNSLGTVIAAERLALTLQATGNLKEAEELLQRCLDARKTLLSEDHIQIAANLLHIARMSMLNSNKLRKMDDSRAIAELDKAKQLLNDSARIAHKNLDKVTKQNGKLQGASGEKRHNARAALVILLQSLDTLGLSEITKQGLQESKGEHSNAIEAQKALFRCISAYKEYGSERPISDSPEAKAEYLSCLKHLLSLMSDTTESKLQQLKGINLKDLKEEIKRVEAEKFPHRRPRN